ncbi:hypothetical protein JI739_19675 [Ramlibacter sp. AW1]|uniref:Uncharacterized protein n=1 Tax=Ramlibacter aurantiacus TaxID=2801330 RepID=A0A936ZJN2_9BURK|nr:hypothetical protein [Ramlibacter aurantiacus]MBL0422574.1 hypothetical protein [Ramlibacter aurantiacus]
MTTVKYLHSAMTGAPTLGNSWGALTDLLDAVLVNGFNLKSVAGVTRDGDTVTVNFATAHGFVPEQIIQVAGCDQADYNGQHRVIWTDTNSARFKVTGTPATPATGAAITCKAAPLGFEIGFTGMNKRAYRSPNLAGSRPFIRINDSLPPNAYDTSWAKFARVSIASGMTDIDTYAPGAAIAPYDPNVPDQNELGNKVGGSGGVHGWWKWRYNWLGSGETQGGSGNRSWDLVGDDRGFFIRINHAWGDYSTFYAAGEFTSFKAGDPFNGFIIAHDWWHTAGSSHSYMNDFARPNYSLDFQGKGIMRNWTGIGNYTKFGFCPLNVNNGYQYSGASGDIPFPNGPDASLVLHPCYMKEEFGSNLRGFMPGLFWAHAYRPYTHRQIIDSVTGNAGKKFVYLTMQHGSEPGSTGGFAIDITGPWAR